MIGAKAIEGSSSDQSHQEGRQKGSHGGNDGADPSRNFVTDERSRNQDRAWRDLAKNHTICKLLMREPTMHVYNVCLDLWNHHKASPKGNRSHSQEDHQQLPDGDKLSKKGQGD